MQLEPSRFDDICQRNDRRRKASSVDHSDEIEPLQRALDGDLSCYSAAGIQTMKERIDALRRMK